VAGIKAYLRANLEPMPLSFMDPDTLAGANGTHFERDAALVIGTYVSQLQELARQLDLPLLTGSTSQRKRDRLFEDFRRGRCRALVVSKIANFAVDLPDASLAIQVSGSFGSRQEEAQRLGRLLRPKAGANQARFYTLVTADTKEQEFALRRQLFLCEQGYTYTIREAAAPSSP